MVRQVVGRVCCRLRSQPIRLGVALALRMIPPAVMDECRARARSELADGNTTGRAAATVIVAIRLGLAALTALLIALAVK